MVEELLGIGLDFIFSFIENIFGKSMDKEEKEKLDAFKDALRMIQSAHQGKEEYENIQKVEETLGGSFGEAAQASYIGASLGLDPKQFLKDLKAYKKKGKESGYQALLRDLQYLSKNQGKGHEAAYKKRLAKMPRDWQEILGEMHENENMEPIGAVLKDSEVYKKTKKPNEKNLRDSDWNAKLLKTQSHFNEGLNAMATASETPLKTWHIHNMEKSADEADKEQRRKFEEKMEAAVLYIQKQNREEKDTNKMMEKLLFDIQLQLQALSKQWEGPSRSEWITQHHTKLQNDIQMSRSKLTGGTNTQNVDGVIDSYPLY